jgi:hypothetical protein
VKEKVMKLFTLLALVIGLGLAPAYAQQEVDPDHFDAQPAKAAALPAHQRLHASSLHHHSRVHMARHNGTQLHHHAHTSA